MTDELTPSQGKRKPLILRNLRQTPYHMRLGDPEKPYRVQLNPRGTAGDIRSIPQKFADEDAVVSAYNLGIIEVITEAEARAAGGERARGGSVRRRVPVSRPEDTSVTVGRISHDAKGNPVLSRAEHQADTANERTQRIADATQVRGAGPNVVGSGRGTGISGADDALAEKFEEAEQEAILEKLSPELRERVLAELGAASRPDEELPEVVRYSDDGEDFVEEEVTPRHKLSDEEIAEHNRVAARLASEADFDAAEERRQAALEEKGVLPEGVLKPRVKVVRSQDQPTGVEDPTAWQRNPGAQRPEGAR